MFDRFLIQCLEDEYMKSINPLNYLCLLGLNVSSNIFFEYMEKERKVLSYSSKRITEKKSVFIMHY